MMMARFLLLACCVADDPFVLAIAKIELLEQRLTAAGIA
jgi:hypothetical protein